MQQLAFELALPARPSFDNFAPGMNREVLAILSAWIANDIDERSIYLWGQPGCGKSHLLLATVDLARARYGSAVYLIGDEVAGLELDGALPALAAIDDAQNMCTASQAAFFRLFQTLRENHTRLLVAGDAPPAVLTLREDVRTRVAAGLVFQLHLLSDQEKAEALINHARARGFALASEAADYLLRHSRRDLASLMALLDAADRYSLQSKRPVNLPLLRDVLQLAQTRRTTDQRG
ncbi:MAG: DnaA regulatory inactivator Hda [Proteobacteria bacterium]|nr:MAG: DnaA regulatory inactivator Hda [Pseudomonadota bacterium]